jgi:hypothetical protein
MLKVCFCAKQVDGLTASRQILTSKKDSIKPPIGQKLCAENRTAESRHRSERAPKSLI